MKKIPAGKVVNIACLACAYMLFMALIKLPAEYYTVLRIVVFMGALLIIATAEHRRMTWTVLFLMVALLFNPLYPIYLHMRTYWIPVDLATGMLFVIYVVLKTTKNETNELNS